MGLIIKAAACSFLLLFAYMQVSAAPTTAAADQKTVTTTPSSADDDLTAISQAAAKAPVSGTGGGADYCAAKCKVRCNDKTVPDPLTDEEYIMICQGVCEKCCKGSNNCVPSGGIGENRRQCKNWGTGIPYARFVWPCP